MTGSGLLRALFFSTLILLAAPEKEGCGEGTEEVSGKCVCKSGLAPDERGNCCHPNLIDIDLEDGEKVCFEDPDEYSVAVGTTLLASFAFIVSMQYFMNHDDPDMRRYAYKCINSTVLIFSSVMFFQCVNSLLEFYVIGRIRNDRFAGFQVDLIQFVLWFIITQFVLCYASDALRPGEHRIKLVAKQNSAIREEIAEFREAKYQVEKSLVSDGVVCAHLTGFASINAWTGLQKMEPFSSSPLMSLVPAILALIVQQPLERISDFVRERIIWRDRNRDFFEDKWDEQCQAAEDDVLGLTLSVIVVNSVRMAINTMTPAGGKCLPNQEQKEVGVGCEFFEIHHGRTLAQIGLLFLAGWLFAIALFLVRLIEDKFFPEKDDQEEEEQQNTVSCSEMVDRIAESIMVALSMGFAWCMFHANKQMLIFMRPDFFGDRHMATTLGLALALEVTYLGFIIIHLLDLLSDLPDEYTPPSVDDSIAAVIDAIALLIGFAWQQLFYEAIQDQAGKFRAMAGPSGPVLAKFIIGSLVSGFIFFTFKKFTVPFIVKEGWNFGVVYSVLDLPNMIEKLEEQGDELAKSYSAGVRDVPDLREYEAHPKDDDEVLAQKNQALEAKLKQAKEETAKAQQSLDNFSDELLPTLESISHSVNQAQWQ